MNVKPDPFEDRPFPDGVTMTDWTGMAWREIPPERVEYLIKRGTKGGKIISFLSQVPVGEGRKRENIPDLKTATGIRNTLYRAASKVWGAKSIKVLVTKNEQTGTYQVEFVHLAPENKSNKRVKAWKKAQDEEIAKDELHKLCLRYKTPTVTGSALYNALRRGEINTIEDLKEASLDDIAKIRDVGPKKLAVIKEMKSMI